MGTIPMPVIARLANTEISCFQINIGLSTSIARFNTMSIMVNGYFKGMR
jgi:hypothetical protein